MNDKQYQTVYLERPDGVIGEFHGIVLFDSAPVEITAIKVSEPKTLPDNTSWTALYEEETNKASTTSDTKT